MPRPAEVQDTYRLQQAYVAMLQVPFGLEVRTTSIFQAALSLLRSRIAERLGWTSRQTQDHFEAIASGLDVSVVHVRTGKEARV